MPKTDHIVVAGDWSAAYRAADRNSSQLSSADRSHQQLLADLHLSPTDADGDNSGRHHTSKADASQHSRIDDLIMERQLEDRVQTLHCGAEQCDR